MGDLDDVLSQVLVDLKPRDLEASRWHFEDTFGVEIDTVMKVIMCTRGDCDAQNQVDFPPHTPRVVCLKELMIDSL